MSLLIGLVIGIVVLVASMFGGMNIRPKSFNSEHVRTTWLVGLAGAVACVVAGGIFVFLGIAIFGIIHGMLGNLVPAVRENDSNDETTTDAE